jgi:putative redox protein
MSTTIKIKNIPEGYQSIITNGTHTIIGDEPIQSKGTNLGLSPSELVLSGLAMCKVATVRHIARKNHWEIGDVQATLQQDVKRTDGSLKTTVKVSISIEGELTETQRATLLREADACYIHRQILGEWDIEKTASSVQPSAALN